MDTTWVSDDAWSEGMSIIIGETSVFKFIYVKINMVTMPMTNIYYNYTSFLTATLETTISFDMVNVLGLYLLCQNCLHLTFEQYFSSETYSRKYEKLPNIVILACKHITEKNAFVENVWPANLALFIYVSTHSFETVKWLDYNRYCQLTRWYSGNAFAFGARGPGFNPRIRQGFLCFIFCFVVVFLLFCQKHIICHKSCQFLLQC